MTHEEAVAVYLNGKPLLGELGFIGKLFINKKHPAFSISDSGVPMCGRREFDVPVEGFELA